MKRAYLIFLSLVSLGCSLKDNQEKQPTTEPHLRFIGEYLIPYRMDFDSTVFGGISGIDYDGKNTYYLLSDDGAQYGNIRYYTASIRYDDSTFYSVDLNSVVILKQEDGTDYPGIKDADSVYADPEAMRLDAVNNRLIWTSEGYRNKFSKEPYIFIHGIGGNHINKFHPGDRYKVDTENFGSRHNGVFEGVSLSDVQNQVWVSTELPLYQDGEVATHLNGGAPIRIFKMDLETSKRLVEYPYQMEPVFTEIDSGGFGMNGIVELLWLDNLRFLVLERAWVKGKGNKVRLYLADFEKATDIISIESLIGKEYKLPTKKLIIDFDDVPLTKVDNIEAFCFGKPMPNGNPTLIFASDDNFGADQISQFILFEVVRPF